MAINKRIFVGRKTELEQFRQTIGSSGKLERILFGAGKGVKSRVILPFGIGGIGKSELAKACLGIAEKAGWKTMQVDWDEIGYRPIEPIQVMNALAEALKNAYGEWLIKAYLEDAKKVNPVREKVQRYRVEHPEEWQKFLEAAQKTGELIPSTPTKIAVSGVTTVLDIGPKILAKAYDLLADKMVESKILKDTEALLYKNKDHHLAQRLVEAIAKASDEQALVILLDTCELLSLTLEEFLRDALVCPTIGKSQRMIFMVVGRYNQYREREVEDSDGSRKYTKGYADRLTDPPPLLWDLAAFADPEVAEYLQACEFESSQELVDFVQQLARGIPFAVQLVVEAMHKLGVERVKTEFPPKDPREFNADEMVVLVVRRFLRYCLDNPKDEESLFALALLRNREDGVLRAVWQLEKETRSRQILTTLEVRYGFVRPDGTLHEVVRAFLRESLRLDNREIANRLGESASNYYYPLWDDETKKYTVLTDRLDEKHWRNLTLDTLNALSWSNEDKAIQFLAARFIEALLFDIAFAKTLLKHAQEFRETQVWWSRHTCKYYDDMLAVISPKGVDELAGVDTLLHQADKLKLTNTHLCLLKTWKANGLVKQNKNSEALKMSLEAEQILPPEADIWHLLAQAFAEIGNNLGFKKQAAIVSEEGRVAYQHAVSLDKTEPGYFNGLGAMYGMLNEFALAETNFSQAIALNPEYATAYNNRGNAYFEQEQYEAARQDYSRAIELNPDDATAYYNRGNAYVRQEQYEAACQDYSRAIELNPEYATAYYNRGNAYIEQEQYEAACQDFSRAIDLNPEYATAYNNRGNAYVRQEQYEAARQDYSRAIELNPDDATAYNNRGNAYFEQEQYEAARQDYSRAIELNPDDATAYYNRGNAYVRQEQYEAARQDYSRAIELNPEYATAYYNRGNAYVGQEQYEAACQDYSRAIELNPDDATAYNNRGNAYFEQEQYEAARQDFSRAIELNPDDATAYNNRGNAYFEQEQYEAARQDYSRAIELNPEYATAYYNRGNAYVRQKQYEAARQDYSRAIELNPDDATAYYNRGNVYYVLKQYAPGLEDFVRAVILEPTNPWNCNAIAVLYDDQKRFSEAIEWYDRALELDAEDARLWSNRGLTFYNAGKYENAVNDFSAAIDRNPNRARYYSHRGLSFFRLNKNDEAHRDFEHALSLDVDNNVFVDLAAKSSLSGDISQAIEHLHKAISLDRADTKKEVAKSTDFDQVRNTPEFQTLWI